MLIKEQTFRLSHLVPPSVVCRVLDYPVEVGPICLCHILYMVTDMDVYTAIHLFDDDRSYRSAIENLVADMRDENGNLQRPEVWKPYINGCELEVGIESIKSVRPVVKLFHTTKNYFGCQMTVGADGGIKPTVGIPQRRELSLDNVRMIDIINYPVVLHDGVAFDGSAPGLKLTVFAFLECVVKGLFGNKKLEKIK